MGSRRERDAAALVGAFLKISKDKRHPPDGYGRVPQI